MFQYNQQQQQQHIRDSTLKNVLNVLTRMKASEAFKVADADRALYQTNNQTINNSEKRIFHSAVSAKPDENEILMLGGVTQ